MQGGGKFNLENASIMILDRDEVSLSIMAQILSGFGARRLDRCTKVRDALTKVQSSAFDLVVVDVTLLKREAFTFIREMRTGGLPANRFATVLATTGHATQQTVSQARDVGVNFILAKPLRPDMVLRRIQWLSEDQRNFIEAPGYVGPDRRHKFEGPPPGMNGRRAEDKDVDIGDAKTDNLFQEEIDRLMQPRKIEI